MADFDAVIVGAGHNALVCALYLASAGWRVGVFERAAEVGGGMRSGELTGPGVLHDLYATNVGLFAASPAYHDFKTRFDQAGLTLLRPDKPYASVFAIGALRVYHDTDATSREFAKFHPGDAGGWAALHALFKRTAPHFLPLFNLPMPSWAAAKQALRLACASPTDAARLARLLRQSSQDFIAPYLQSEEARGLFASWAHHLDFGPDVPGGATFAFVAAMAGYQGGMAVAEGGAGRISETMRQLIEAAGGRVTTRAEVTRIVVARGRAVAVELADGAHVTFSKAIVAGVTPRNLYRRLLGAADLDPGFLRKVDAYRYGAGTFIIHLVLNGAPSWRFAEDLAAFNYVHLCGSEAEIAATYRQCGEGELPTRPLLVVSQPTAIDPTRAPTGQSIMRVHVRTVPGAIRRDAGGTIQATSWQEAREPFADRVLDLVSEQVPNLRRAIAAIRIVDPHEIECDNPNFIGGDCVSGSHHHDQNFFNRPFRGWSRYRTPIDGLYVTGASTWPGGGVNAGSGYLAAQELLRRCG